MHGAEGGRRRSEKIAPWWGFGGKWKVDDGHRRHAVGASVESYEPQLGDSKKNQTPVRTDHGEGMKNRESVKRVRCITTVVGNMGRQCVRTGASYILQLAKIP
jgi:hypothetical protein